MNTDKNNQRRLRVPAAILAAFILVVVFSRGHTARERVGAKHSAILHPQSEAISCPVPLLKPKPGWNKHLARLPPRLPPSPPSPGLHSRQSAVISVILLVPSKKFEGKSPSRFTSRMHSQKKCISSGRLAMPPKYTSIIRRLTGPVYCGSTKSRGAAVWSKNQRRWEPVLTSRSANH